MKGYEYGRQWDLAASEAVDNARRERDTLPLHDRRICDDPAANVEVRVVVNNGGQAFLEHRIRRVYAIGTDVFIELEK